MPQDGEDHGMPVESGADTFAVPAGSDPGQSPRSTGAVDACVFHEWSSIEEIAPYIEGGWRDLLTTLPPRQIQPRPLYSNPLGGKREETYPAQGSIGLSYEVFADEILDNRAAGRVVLGYDESILLTASASFHAAKSVIRAINTWTQEDWLARDERLHGLILVSGSMPDVAAEEIRRLGADDRMVGVAIGANALNLTFGHPAYRPILKAAAEQGLPIVLQASSDLAASLLTAPVAGGQATMYGEYQALNTHSPMSHLAAMIIQGVFEELPELKVLVVGGGVTWVPGYVWRLDYAHRFNHQSSPWLKREPSEYFRDHVKIATYQLEQAPSREQLEAVLTSAPWMQSSLVYTSGYPNSDSLTPELVASRLPAGWTDDVLRTNADGLFRWAGGTAS